MVSAPTPIMIGAMVHVSCWMTASSVTVPGLL
jgi:hypothetical protein